MKSMGSGKRKHCLVESSSSSSSDASEESEGSSVSSLSTDDDKKSDSEQRPPKSDDETLEVADMHSVETEADAAGVTGVDPKLTRRGPGEGGDGIHVLIRRQAELEEWPNGPSSLAELFQWQSSNARHFIGVDSKDKDNVRLRLRRLLKVLELDLEINEAYGGTGNGAATLHQQHRALVQQASATIAALNSLGGLASLAKFD